MRTPRPPERFSFGTFSGFGGVFTGAGFTVSGKADFGKSGVPRS